MQCNKVLINICPALRLVWGRINGGLSTFIFSDYGMTLFIEIIGGTEIVSDTLSIYVMKSTRLIALHLATELYQ